MEKDKPLCNGCYGKKNDNKSSIDSYLTAIKYDPGDAGLYYNCALRYKEAGNEKSAEEFLQKAIRIKPDYADARIQIGALYQSKGMFKKAILEYEGALEHDRRNFLAYYNMALAYENVDMKKAVSLWKTAIDIAEEKKDRGQLLPEMRNHLARLEAGIRNGH